MKTQFLYYCSIPCDADSPHALTFFLLVTHVIFASVFYDSRWPQCARDPRRLYSVDMSFRDWEHYGNGWGISQMMAALRNSLSRKLFANQWWWEWSSIQLYYILRCTSQLQYCLYATDMCQIFSWGIIFFMLCNHWQSLETWISHSVPNKQKSPWKQLSVFSGAYYSAAVSILELCSFSSKMSMVSSWPMWFSLLGSFDAALV